MQLSYQKTVDINNMLFTFPLNTDNIDIKNMD